LDSQSDIVDEAAVADEPVEAPAAESHPEDKVDAAAAAQADIIPHADSEPDGEPEPMAPTEPALEVEPDPAPPVAQDAPDETLDDGVAETSEKQGFFARIASGLKKTSSRFSDSVTAVFTQRKLDDEALEELEDLLIAADLGAATAARVTARLAKDKFDKDVTADEVKEALAEVVAETLEPYAQPLDMSGPSPRVVLFVGVNGSGKTTTLGKIAVKMTREGADIVTAAGDTFRAAAVEQLEVWSKRAGATFLSRPIGADAAGLAFDALEQARTDKADALLIDTAGRLQNKAELMDELRKIVRVIRKIDETAPHHVLLVLDGTVGSNALSQAEAFMEAADVTGVIMTKLDGTAKGGALVQVAEKFKLPIHFIGVGEGEADLTAFDAKAFARALAGLEG
jgi:fused signal recognition particle receptor